MNDVSSASLKVGTVLSDKWVILEFIGKGGMGEVYRAHQTNLRRDVAIKVVSKEWLQSLGDDEKEIEIAFQRFRIEVQAMAQVRHPNILQIYDFGAAPLETGEKKFLIEFIAMEYIPGGTFRSTMSEEGFAPEEDLTRTWLLSCFFPVLDGVRAMHNLGIIHRDLKPENIFMDGKIPKIADFGLARSFRLKPVTQSIDVKGTLPYMSPEHFFDLKHTDQRADIYSLGKILCEAIEGRETQKSKPFKSVGLSDPETPFFQKLDPIIRNATAEDREKRIDSVEKFHEALRNAVEKNAEKRSSEISVTSRRLSLFRNPKWIWSGIAVAVLSVALMTLWHLFGEPGRSEISPQVPRITSRREGRPVSLKSSDAASQSQGAPVPSMVTEDGATLHLIPGGKIRVPDNFGPASGESLDIAPFYMDETQVTNHQYVEFLNKVRPRISVEKGVVKGNGKIWLLLGEIEKGYEPITYARGIFHVNHSADASHPVLRVTAYGASTYARFYGRRLPSVSEWLYAATDGTGKYDNRNETGTAPSNMMATDGMHQQMHPQETHDTGRPADSWAPLPVDHFEPNAFGIRGLGKSIDEWGKLAPEFASGKGTQASDYAVLGAASLVARYPWEAFENVGFRCALGLSATGKE